MLYLKQRKSPLAQTAEGLFEFKTINKNHKMNKNNKTNYRTRFLLLSNNPNTTTSQNTIAYYSMLYAKTNLDIVAYHVINAIKKHTTSLLSKFGHSSNKNNSNKPVRFSQYYC